MHYIVMAEIVWGINPSMSPHEYSEGGRGGGALAHLTLLPVLVVDGLPSDRDVLLSCGLTHTPESLYTLTNGTVDVLLTERLGCSSKYGHLLCSCC